MPSSVRVGARRLEPRQELPGVRHFRPQPASRMHRGVGLERSSSIWQSAGASNRAAPSPTSAARRPSRDYPRPLYRAAPRSPQRYGDQDGRAEPSCPPPRSPRNRRNRAAGNESGDAAAPHPASPHVLRRRHEKDPPRPPLPRRRPFRARPVMSLLRRPGRSLSPSLRSRSLLRHGHRSPSALNIGEHHTGILLATPQWCPSKRSARVRPRNPEPSCC